MTPFVGPNLVRRPSAGWWLPGAAAPTCDPDAVADTLGDLDDSVVVVHTPDGLAAAPGGVTSLGGPAPSNGYPLAAYLPALRPQDLGDPGFLAAHGVKYAYMTGAMANGIASTELVGAVGRAGMLGSFGAAGLSLPRVSRAIDALEAALAGRPCCFNLIHSPNEPAHEAAVADLYLTRGVKTVEASAYLDLTPAVVRYRVAGLAAGPGGVVANNKVIAKVSRVEVAAKFLGPPPPRMLAELVAAKLVTADQAKMAAHVAMCDDLTAEADSGGHTDNRPAVTLLPTLLALRDRLGHGGGVAAAVRVGLAGGLATPAAVAAAFAMGAAYVVTGSVNQACVEIRVERPRPQDARRGRPGGRDDGPGGRHVRDGGESAGAQARHHVRHARGQAVRDLPAIRRLGGGSGGRPRPD